MGKGIMNRRYVVNLGGNEQWHLEISENTVMKY